MFASRVGSSKRGAMDMFVNGILLVFGVIAGFLLLSLTINLILWAVSSWPIKDWGKAEDARRKSLGY